MFEFGGKKVRKLENSKKVNNLYNKFFCHLSNISNNKIYPQKVRCTYNLKFYLKKMLLKFFFFISVNFKFLLKFFIKYIARFPSPELGDLSHVQ